MDDFEVIIRAASDRLRDEAKSRCAAVMDIALACAQIRSVLDRKRYGDEDLPCSSAIPDQGGGETVYAVFDIVPAELADSVSAGEIVRIPFSLFDFYGSWCIRRATREEESDFEQFHDRRGAVDRFASFLRRVALLNPRAAAAA